MSRFKSASIMSQNKSGLLWNESVCQQPLAIKQSWNIKHGCNKALLNTSLAFWNVESNDFNCRHKPAFNASPDGGTQALSFDVNKPDCKSQRLTGILSSDFVMPKGRERFVINIFPHVGSVCFKCLNHDIHWQMLFLVDMVRYLRSQCLPNYMFFYRQWLADGEPRKGKCCKK